MATVARAAQSATAPIAPTGPRLLYLDDLRTLLITLVVVGHLAITYGAPGSWYYYEPGQLNPLVLGIMLLLAGIFKASLLGLFCFIAGYFTVPAFDRKGPRAFLLDRVKRLLIPLAVYEFILNPVINYVRDIHEGAFGGSFAAYLGLFFSPLKSIGDGPVWFLLMLFVFSAAYAGWRLLAPLVQAPGRGCPVPTNRWAALFAITLGLATFVVRFWAPVGKTFEPWHQELAAYPQYVLMFSVGLVAYRGEWLATYPHARARPWWWLIPAVVLGMVGVAIAAGALSGIIDERGAGGANFLSLAYSMWEGWTCVTLSIVILTWFRARAGRGGRLARELSADAFTVYVLHPAIIVPLAIALSRLSLDLGLKFLLVTPTALVLCYGAAALLRRLPLAREIM